MRLVFAALAAFLGLAAAPATAQYCDCRRGAIIETGPAAAVPRTVYVPLTVLVPRTRLEPRLVYVPRMRLVPRVVYPARSRYGADPTYGAGYPSGYHYGATYVPPGTSYPCLLGALGCDSSAVGPVDD